MKKNNLAEGNPELAKEWHPTLNGDLTPMDVTLGSNKKVWWQCVKGHQWESMVCNRNNGKRCPYCSGKRILVGYNDLATTNPEVSEEWHPTLNGDMTPNCVTFGSGKRIWWRCGKGHEWERPISHRSRGAGCPFCAGKKTLKCYNDLATVNPELAKEWHPTLNKDLTPYEVGSGSHKKVWWLCSKGHEWEATVANRNKRSGCPKCSAEMRTSFPEQAIYYYLKQATSVEVESRASVCGMEVDIFIPSWKIGIEYDGAYFHNSDKSTARENIKNETLAENGIHLIRIKESTSRFEDTQNIIYCVPGNGHSFLTLPLLNLAERLSEIKKIPIHFDVNFERDGIKILEQYIEGEKLNSLAARNPILAEEWHPIKNGRLTPEQVSYGSKKRVWWQCRKYREHEWRGALYNRMNGDGCPYCSNRKILVGNNDLATTHPEIAQEWHPNLNGTLTASDIVAGAGKKIWWQCARKHEWQTRVVKRKIGRGNCPECKELSKQNPKNQ